MHIDFSVFFLNIIKQKAVLMITFATSYKITFVSGLNLHSPSIPLLHYQYFGVNEQQSSTSVRK